MAYSAQVFNKAREYLRSFADNQLDDRRTMPSGAQPTFWMYTYPTQPKNNFDEVFPGIVLGDHQLARNKPQLQAIGITHILNCAMGAKFNQVNTNADYYSMAGIQFMGIKAQDSPTYNMMPHFRPCAEYIDKALKSGGKVYVHCQSGVSRSATITLASLMLQRNMELMNALMTVRTKREVYPNDGFLKQLCELDKTLYGDKYPEEEKQDTSNQKQRANQKQSANKKKDSSEKQAANENQKHDSSSKKAKTS
ncbi:hypothetical protein ACJMK2_010366 [Sinanodonta woodiana]|uniref:protein-serine/threonine phosphatase n=1 Tax=Sinanodonta woodiana TaxID=1069815 RepID=A0ABD3VF41_SINWO